MVSQTLQHETFDVSVKGEHRIEAPKAVPEAVKQKIGYDIEKTLKLLKDNWTPRQKELLNQYFDPALAKASFTVLIHVVFLN